MLKANADYKDQFSVGDSRFVLRTNSVFGVKAAFAPSACAGARWIRFQSARVELGHCTRDPSPADAGFRMTSLSKTVQDDVMSKIWFV
jgi:hypothetical protein